MSLRRKYQRTGACWVADLSEEGGDTPASRAAKARVGAVSPCTAAPDRLDWASHLPNLEAERRRRQTVLVLFEGVEQDEGVLCPAQDPPSAVSRG